MNKILTILLIYLLIIQVNVFAQYKDFIVTTKFIYGLSQNGQLKLFDKSNGKLIEKEISNSSEILFIAKDKTNKLIIADKDNLIKRYIEQNNSWEIISIYEGNIYGILFDSNNHGFIITEKGIEDVQNHKLYFSNNSLNHQINYENKWGQPYCYYMDSTDKIWLGFGYGEWGGNLIVFETATNQFLTPNLGTFEIALWPIKSFFEDSTSVYLSAGLQHMMTTGIIIRFNNLKATTVFRSYIHWDFPNKHDSIKSWMDAEYIGPATYDKSNNSIYFYSQNGIFNGNIAKDLSKIGNWEFIIKPKLHWESGQRDAVGSPMNVSKISIIDKNKFIFLSQSDGIGYFDGDKLTMLK
ncbi:MAG: hypothetical protein NTZ69_06645 [Bacteroidia bacterium]|nr:hypothetical protein [Bacteroidia bacterium]